MKKPYALAIVLLLASGCDRCAKKVTQAPTGAGGDAAVSGPVIVTAA